MAACQLCRIDGEAPAFHCRDCNVWICATCRTVHLNISGAGDHDIILAPTKRDQLVNELRALAKRVTFKLEICDVNANRCQAAMRDLKGDNVTSLDASLKAREQTIAKVNELFDSIDEQLRSFYDANNSIYVAANENFVTTAGDLRQHESAINDVLDRISSDVTVVDANLTSQLQCSVQERLDLVDAAAAVPSIPDAVPKIILIVDDAFDVNNAAVFEVRDDVTRRTCSADDANAATELKEDADCEHIDDVSYCNNTALFEVVRSDGARRHKRRRKAGVNQDVDVANDRSDEIDDSGPYVNAEASSNTAPAAVFVCELCDTCLEIRKSLVQHVKDTHRERPRRCKVCSQALIAESSQVLTRMVVHAEMCELPPGGQVAEHMSYFTDWFCKKHNKLAN